MNNDDVYMTDFMRVFKTLERWGPGSESDTKRALSLLRTDPHSILEIGCGKGLATEVLLKRTNATVTALDTEQEALNKLEQRFAHRAGLERLKTTCASMTELPFASDTFDLIWSEGSTYIMGVEKALTEWKSVLTNHGNLVLSDMVWKTYTPSQESIDLWAKEYPDIQSIETRIKQMKAAGYSVIDHFAQSKQAWLNYFEPLSKRVADLESEMPDSLALKDIKHETDVCLKLQDEFGYHVFILERV